MDSALRQYEISDEIWSLLEPHLPGKRGQWGGIAKDNRQFLNGVFWILRTGSPWRDLPSEYGNWKNIHRRFCRWRDKGIWEKLLEILIQKREFEWLLYDSEYIAAIDDMSQKYTKRKKKGSAAKYIWPWMRMICRSELLLQKVPLMTTGELIRKTRNHNK